MSTTLISPAGRAALRRAHARFGAPLRAVLRAVAAAADDARRDAQAARAEPGASGARAEVLGLRLRLLSLGDCSGGGGDSGEEEEGQAGEEAGWQEDGPEMAAAQWVAEELQEALLAQMLIHPEYEVRLAALVEARHLLRLPPSSVDDGVPPVAQAALPEVEDLGEIGEIEVPRLRPAACTALLLALGAMVDTEAQRACTLHALQLLCDAPAALLAPLRARLWRGARARLAASRDSELRALALRLAAACSVACAAAEAEEWVELLGAAGAADQSLCLRLAAASALGSSALLDDEIASGRGGRGGKERAAGEEGEAVDAAAAAVAARRSLRAWLLALRALDDDDDDVREAAAACLSPRLAPGRFGLHHSVLLQLGWQAVAQRFAPALPAPAPAAADLLDVLMVRLVGAPLGADAVAMRDAMPTPEALGGGSGGDSRSKGEDGGSGGAGGGEGGGGEGDCGGVANFRRVLFDKERDNFYEEPVQQAQLSATLLRAALSRIAAPHAAAAAARWQGTLLARKGSATRDSSAPLLGGGAEAFLWETRIALALWAVAPTEQDPACGAAWPLEDPPLAVVELLGPP